MKILEQKELDAILFRITEVFVIEQIYLWISHWGDQKRYMLQILMRKGNGQAFTDANIYVGTVAREYANIDYVVCFPHEIQKKVKQGLGRAILICQPENLVYEHPEVQQKIKIPEIDVGKILAKTESYVQSEIKKIDAFMDGYRFYYEKGNLSHAAFMLHQVVELSYRAAEHLLVGDERRTHCLRTHQNYLGKYAWNLGELFRTGERSHIIDKLDEAYSAIRYDQDYKIKRKVLEMAVPLADYLVQWLRDYGAYLLQEIDTKLRSEDNRLYHPSDDTAMNKTMNTDHRDLILDALKTYCSPSHVACFGYRGDSSRTIHVLDASERQEEMNQYYVMAVCNDFHVPILGLQAAVMNRLPSHIRVTLLPFEQVHFQKQCDKQSAFYLALLKQSELWSQDLAISIPEEINIAEVDLRAQKLRWETSIERANQLYVALTADSNHGTAEVVCYGLALALEQVCLGMIGLFWQFQPQSTNLNHLLELCTLICPSATEVFALDHPREREVFKLLVEAQSQFRHHADYRTEREHLMVLTNRIEVFMAKAQVHAQEYIDAEEKRRIITESAVEESSEMTAVLV